MRSRKEEDAAKGLLPRAASETADTAFCGADRPPSANSPPVQAAVGRKEQVPGRKRGRRVPGKAREVSGRSLHSVEPDAESRGRGEGL